MPPARRGAPASGRSRGRLRSPIPARWLLAGVLLAALLALGSYLGFRAYVLLRPRPILEIDQTRRARRVDALAAYARREDAGSLLPPGNVVLALREDFLQRAIESSLPVRQDFQGGRYVAKLTSAVVSLDAGLAAVSLAGRGMVAGEENSPFHIDLYLYGLVSVVDVDPDSGTVSASIVITDVKVKSAGPRRLRNVFDPATRFFSRLRAQDWNRQRRSIRLPVLVQQEIVLPEINGDVHIPESRVPLSVTVSSVTTLDRRMAVSLALHPDSTGGEPPEPPVPEVFTTRPLLDSTILASISRRGGLGAEELRLRRKVEAGARQDEQWRAVMETDHDVVVIVPAPVLRTVVRRVARRYLRGVEVDFRPELDAHFDKQLKVAMLGRKVGAGRIHGTVHISHLRGLLSMAGPPRVVLAPPRDLVILAPVRVLSGQGTVQVHSEWDPAALVSVVCRAFAFDNALVGQILPLRHDLVTRVHFAVIDSTLAGRPRVQRDKIQIPTDLNDSSWARVRDKLDAENRLLRCGLFMSPEDILQKLRQVATRGIGVRLPARIFPHFHLPLTLADEYPLGDYAIRARAYDPAIEVRRDYLRFAFRARLRVASEGRPVLSRPDTATAANSGRSARDRLK